MSAALDRLIASRERLRAAMLPASPANDQPRMDRSDSWLDKLARMPTVTAMVDSVRAWWATHPLRPVAQVAAEAAGAVAAPVAQRHPFRLVLVAALVGAGLVWSRPWRWIFSSALFAGLVPQLVSRVMSNLPLESWMTMLGTALAAQKTTPHASTAGGAPVG